jgi:hypothetical protein
MVKEEPKALFLRLICIIKSVLNFVSDKITHTISLKKFEFPNGEIPFSVLSNITEQLRKISEGALRLYLEGHSNNKRGREPDWMEKSLDFSLSGIKKGSTILEVKAPLLTDTLGSYQQPLFEELGVQNLNQQTAIGLALIAYEKATEENANTDTFDKNLLKVMLGFNKFFGHDSKAYIDIKGTTTRKITIAPKTLQKIKILEEKMPVDQKVKITGKLEMMRHSNNLLELVNPSGKYKVYLNSDYSFEKAKGYFGEEITCTGVAHFNPKGKISSIEIIDITHADKSASYFENSFFAIQEKLDLPGLASEQNYKGTTAAKIKKLVKAIDIEDDLSELLETLNA